MHQIWFFIFLLPFALVESIREPDRTGKKPQERVPIFVPGEYGILGDGLATVDSGKMLRMAEKKSSLRNFNRKNVKTQQNNSSAELCMTKDCIVAASTLLESMDENIDPCQDFYHFVCGSYIDHAIIPEYSDAQNAMGEIDFHKSYKIHQILSSKKTGTTKEEQFVRDFYNSCMDLEQIEKLKYEPLFSLLEDMKMFNPLFERNSPKVQEQNLEDTLLKSLSTFFANTPLFDLDFERDLDNAKNSYVITISQPRLSLPPSMYKEKNAFFWKFMDAYQRFNLMIASELAGSLPNRRISDLEISALISKALDFEVELGSKLQQNTTLDDNARKMNLSEFSNILGPKQNVSVDIVRLIKRFIEEATDYKLPDSTIIAVPHLEYFQHLYSLMQSFSEQDILNYVTFQIIKDLSRTTNSTMRKIWMWFVSMFTGVIKEPPRWRTCVQKATDYFGAKVSQLFVEDRNGFETKNSSERMVEYLQDSFRTIIKDADWMDETTRERALSKLEKITVIDTFYQNQLTDNFLQNVYANLSGISSDTFFDNLITMYKFWTRKIVKKIHETPKFIGDAAMIEFDTTLVNAMYIGESNSVWLPLGIQAPPIFNGKRPMPMNFGSIGVIIGHELTHGFDNNGGRYDEDGNLRNWWTNETEATFKEKQKCFVDQYNDFEFSILKNLSNYHGPTHVDGEKTLGENIADNGGFRESFYAYRALMQGKKEQRLPGLENYSSDQVFFMSFARSWCETRTLAGLAGQLMNDVHSPAPARVQVTLRNSPEFQAAFQCSDDDPMVAKQRCRIW